MYMTEADILLEYRQAKDKKAMIQILAEENGVPKDRIRDILCRAGEDVIWRAPGWKKIDESILMELYQQGLTDNSIAKETGISSGSVRNWRKARNLPPSKSAGFDKKQARALYDQGWHDGMIARKMGVHHGSVHHWRTREGLPPNLMRRKKGTVEAE